MTEKDDARRIIDLDSITEEDFEEMLRQRDRLMAAEEHTARWKRVKAMKDTVGTVARDSLPNTVGNLIGSAILLFIVSLLGLLNNADTLTWVLAAVIFVFIVALVLPLGPIAADLRAERTASMRTRRLMARIKTLEIRLAEISERERNQRE